MKREPWMEGYSLCLSHCKAQVVSWMKTEDLLLKGGDMTAQEIRTVKAVLKQIIRSFEAMEGKK